MIDRIVRAIKLDPTLYRLVADNESYMREATLIVLIVSLLSALGSGIGAAIGKRAAAGAFFAELFSSILLGWLLWAAISYLVGTALGGRSSVMEMARTLGYASAPRLLSVLGFIPCIGFLFSLAGWILSIIAGVIAIRESMEFDTNKAIITAVVGFLVYLIASIILWLVFGGLAFLGGAIFNR
jgi:hypothetical protein